MKPPLLANLGGRYVPLPGAASNGIGMALGFMLHLVFGVIVGALYGTWAG